MTPSLGASRLEALLESAQLLHASLDLDDLLRHLLRSVMGRLLVGRGLIAVETNHVMRLALVRGLPKLSVGEMFDEAIARAAGIDLLLPIGEEAQPVGYLGISRPASGPVDPEEVVFLKALLGIAASGIANARAHAESQRLNQDLDQKVQELRALLDLGRGLTSTLEPDDVARLLMLTLAGRWAVRKYALAAWKDGHPPALRRKGMELSPLDVYKQHLGALPEAAAVEHLPESDLKQTLLSQQAQAVFPIRSGDSESGGIVILGPRPGDQPFNEADLDFGAGLVAQAAVAFDNSWYFRETVEKKKIEQELQLAASIQANLFPTALPQLSAYDLAARNRPARHCGGDYYDALLMAQADAERHLLCVADVSGKGLPASLLMSTIQATLRALLGRVPSLVELAAHTNELLYATTPANKYVTAILLTFDPATGEGRYVNAGHTDCVVLRAGGDPVWLKATGTPLGLLPGMPYVEQSLDLQPGDIAALFSDGVTEAQDEKETEFGEELLVNCLRAAAHKPAEQIVAAVFDEIDRFAGLAPQYDDITLLILKRTA